MNNKLSPYYQASIQIEEVEGINFKIIESFKELNWEITQVSENKIEGNAPISLTSWGEKIQITIIDNYLYIKSNCIGNQILDSGKNKENVLSFIEEIQNKTIVIDSSEKTVISDKNKKRIKPNLLQFNKKNGFFSFLEIFKIQKGYFITPIMIIVNIIIFIIMAIDGANIINPSVEKIIEWGANERALTLNGEAWRLLSSIFIHIGIIHLIMNLYALLYVGSLLEPFIGKTKFIIAYFVCGLLASTASIWWHTFSVSAGASGAIFGLFGVFIALLTTNFIEKSFRKPLLIYMGIYIGINLLNGLNSGVDAAAHIGGLVTGIIIGYIISYTIIVKESKSTNYWINGAIVFLGLSVSFLVLREIPNPLKNYKSESKEKLDYFKLYEKKIKDYATNETLALELFSHRSDDKEDFLNFANDRTMWYWKENLKIVKEIEKYSLPKNMLDYNQIVKKYTKLRIKQTEIIYKRVKLDDEKLDRNILEVNQEIENALYDISKFK
jgi:rhomboid protease GluP